MTLFQHLVETLKKRTKRMIGFLISLIIGLITVTATAATAGVALSQVWRRGSKGEERTEQRAAVFSLMLHKIQQKQEVGSVEEGLEK